MKSLLDHQGSYLLSILFLLYIYLQYVLNLKDHFVVICSDSFDLSQSLILTLFSSSMFFSVFATQQLAQLINFVYEDDVEFVIPLIKINLSSIFICFVCSTMLYERYSEKSHHLCVDMIGFIFYYSVNLNKITRLNVN
jgi:hypothetical protein